MAWTKDGGSDFFARSPVFWYLTLCLSCAEAMQGEAHGHQDARGVTVLEDVLDAEFIFT
jgi:hypothetical protein